MQYYPFHKKTKTKNNIIAILALRAKLTNDIYLLVSAVISLTTINILCRVHNKVNVQLMLNILLNGNILLFCKYSNFSFLQNVHELHNS